MLWMTRCAGEQNTPSLDMHLQAVLEYVNGRPWGSWYAGFSLLPLSVVALMKEASGMGRCSLNYGVP